MDLGAYVQIETLSELAKANGIEVNRLRGYRLMKDEKPVDIDEVCKSRETEMCEELCSMKWNPKSEWRECSSDTDILCKKFINNYENRYKEGEKISINWDAMTEEEAKILKEFIENRFKDYRAQWKLWNSFCGRNDVLYIHARLGRTNWSDTHFEDYKDEPWYLDGCTDAWDTSYCDLYAKIKPFEGDIKEDLDEE